MQSVSVQAGATTALIPSSCGICGNQLPLQSFGDKLGYYCRDCNTGIIWEDDEDEGVREYPPIHPGVILQEEFLEPMCIEPSRLAKDISVPVVQIEKILRGEQGISADMALRLARYFGVSVNFWTGIQNHYEVQKAKMVLAGRLEKEVKVLEQ